MRRHLLHSALTLLLLATSILPALASTLPESDDPSAAIRADESLAQPTVDDKDLQDVQERQDNEDSNWGNVKALWR